MATLTYARRYADPAAARYATERTDYDPRHVLDHWGQAGPPEEHYPSGRLLVPYDFGILDLLVQHGYLTCDRDYERHDGFGNSSHGVIYRRLDGREFARNSYTHGPDYAANGWAK